jgi:hypothetical protein
MTALAFLQRRMMSILMATALVCGMQMVVSLSPPGGPTPSFLKAERADAATCGTNDIGCKLYNGQLGILQESPKPFDSKTHGHGETTTIQWNNQLLMYYRSYIKSDGSSCQFPTGIALAKSTDGGTTWQAQNGGKPLSTLSSVMPGGCAEATNITATELYSPDVIVDGSQLLMVFERRDTDTTGARCAVGRACISMRRRQSC